MWAKGTALSWFSTTSTPSKAFLSCGEGSSLQGLCGRSSLLAHMAAEIQTTATAPTTVHKYQLWGALRQCPPSGMLLHFVQAINTEKQVYNPELLFHMTAMNTGLRPLLSRQDKCVSFGSHRLTFLHYILLHTTDTLPVQKNIWKYGLCLCNSPKHQQVDARDTEHTILLPEKNNLALKLNFTEVVSTDNLSEKCPTTFEFGCGHALL